MSAKDHPNNAPGVPMVYPADVRAPADQIHEPHGQANRAVHARCRQGQASRPQVWETYETVVTPFRKGHTLAIALGHGKTDWVKNVLAANEADVLFGSRTVHIVNPRILPAGSGGADDLPFMARAQAKKMAIFVADIA